MFCDYRKLKLEEVRKHELIPKHDNCVQFIGAWEEDDFLYIQLELCRTSLEEYTEMNHEITQEMLWDILLDILLVFFNFNHLTLSDPNLHTFLNNARMESSFLPLNLLLLSGLTYTVV
jgi:hypothetical protein